MAYELDAKLLVSKFNAVSNCNLTPEDSAWLVRNIANLVQEKTRVLELAAGALANGIDNDKLPESYKHLVGIIEDLYDAVDTAHLSDELRDDIREVLKGDV